jgi:hypothetical protein
MRGRARRLPRGVLGHAGGGPNRGRRPIYLDDENSDARPQPSLAPCSWLLRPDPDELRQARERQCRERPL